jgi:hypothetical protein
MNTPIEQVASLAIGTVEFVSPSEIKVLLDLEAPQATALNTGVPTGFPRINGYVLIPNETGAVVGLVTWLGVEHSAFPKRTGLKDFGLIDLPFPQRKLSLTPVGTLLRSGAGSHSHYRLQRGISVFPSVGDSVLLPTADQLRSIVEAAEPEDRRVQIGTSPLASNAKVTIDPNKLFGRHVAVLGNTGSGKSCSVAGLIRWSLTEAAKVAGNMNSVNARFIVLDPNGEYSRAFTDMTNARVFRVPPVEEPFRPLVVPAWMWNSQEWTAFAHAAPGVQRPLLLRALRELRSGSPTSEPVERRVGRLARGYWNLLQVLIAQGPEGYTNFPGNRNCGDLLRNIVSGCSQYTLQTTGPLRAAVTTLVSVAQTVITARAWQNGNGFNAFSEPDLQQTAAQLEAVLTALGEASQTGLVSEDAPVEFDVSDMPDHLGLLANEVGGGQTVQFVATLQMRIEMLLADTRLGAVINPEVGASIEFQNWLSEYIGQNGAANGQLAILDLSLVSSDVLHIVMAVIARIVFEAIQRYRRLNDAELPTTLVLEEAHNFIRRGEDGEEGFITAAQMCRQTFERIAREGRKFGLGLVLASQRPFEISPTVLAQCNTFLLHRLVNDDDQKLVSRLVPDNLGGLLRELPSLPSKQAILLGWATPVPVLVEINDLPESQRPKSSDPKFWEVWTGAEQRPINWTPIVEEWTGSAPQAS